MVVSGSLRWVSRLLPVLLVAGLVAAGVAGTAVASADEEPAECFVSAASLGEARELYGRTCSLPRVDCDRLDGVWFCSNRVIGDAAPGGVTPEEGGRSGIGGPPTTSPVPTTGPPTTPEPSTTVVPPTTAPSVPTTSPPTDPPTTTTPDPGDGGGGGEVITRTYVKNDGPERNPMKGWNSGWSDDRSESTVGFQYIKWSDLEPRNGSFDFDAVEDVIARSGSRDRHVVLRLYCDWWGANEQSRGCPNWMYSEVGVERIRGDNGRYITDYNDPRYVNEAVQAIQALGDRYDDDPRVYAFQIGVLGFWGEWHTWGSSVNGQSYEITEETQSTILNAYRDAFDRVRIVARYPDRSVLAAADDIGFHNDYFRPNNGHSDEFDNAVSDGQRWLDGPIGGEIPPGLSSDEFRALYTTSQGREMIETGHYSTMKPTSVDAQYLDRHMELHKLFGYNFQIDRARFAERHATSGRVAVELQVENVGIAPFYYDWQVQFALIGEDGRAVSITDATAHDLRQQLPGDAFTLTGRVPLTSVNDGTYRLAVRIIQPGADDTKAQPWRLRARNTYILFANDMPTIDGSWNERHQLVGGWSILGRVVVE